MLVLLSVLLGVHVGTVSGGSEFPFSLDLALFLHRLLRPAAGALPDLG